jgi:hypothetical protein
MQKEIKNVREGPAGQAWEDGFGDFYFSILYKPIGASPLCILIVR